ncbi:MAG: SEC-C metal-binding domain-containing protein [Ignavibacteria bacterium]|nr:SEC-C metal-binding domain-containing protein [Ignavibacteria bacterium]
MNTPSFSAFTVNNNGRLREIITDIGISVPITDQEIKFDDPRIYRTSALWDTGATNCVVTKSTANSMGLIPIGLTNVFHADGNNTANVYLVNIYLPNNIVISGVKVTECSDAAGAFGVIIGMDVITMGDFAITNLSGNTSMSFRIPSLEKIDYVEQAQRLNKNHFKGLPRNSLCPCGSGMKVKNCHGKNL